MKKSLQRLIGAALFGVFGLVLSSCGTLGGVSRALVVPAIEMSGSVSIVPTKVVTGLQTIDIGGKSYRASAAKSLICRVDVNIINDGETSVREPPPDDIELASMRKAGGLALSIRTIPGFLDLAASGSVLANVPGRSTKAVQWFFVYGEDDVPAALLIGRVKSTLLLPEKSAFTAAVKDGVAKLSAIEVLHALAQTSSYSIVKAMADSLGVGLDDVDRNGFTLLYVGILAGNDGIVAGCIADGANIHAQAYYKFQEIEPVHAAIIVGNTAAIDRLAAVGVDPLAVSPKGADPLELAVMSGKIDSVRKLYELGADFSRVKFQFTFGKDQTAIEYARKQGFNDIAVFLAGVIGG